MVTATQSSHKGYDGVLRVLENPKRRVCRCGLKLRYGVAEHWEHHRECLGDRGPVRTEKCLASAHKILSLSACLTRDGL